VKDIESITTQLQLLKFFFHNLYIWVSVTGLQKLIDIRQLKNVNQEEQE